MVHFVFFNNTDSGGSTYLQRNRQALEGSTGEGSGLRVSER